MAVTCNWRNEVYTHVEFTVGEEEKVHRLGGPELDYDGHCIYSSDGEFVCGDGYWDEIGCVLLSPCLSPHDPSSGIYCPLRRRVVV